MSNVYFELTAEFNPEGPVAVLASGQAVVFYRISMIRSLPKESEYAAAQ